MLLKESHPKIQENNAVTDAAQHLDEVLDSCQGLRWDVLEGVVGLDDPAADQADDPGPVEQLGRDVGHVGGPQQGQGLNNPHAWGQLRGQRSEESVDKSNREAPECHSEKGSKAEENLRDSNVDAPGLHPSEYAHHVVEDHRHPVVEDWLAKHEEVEVGVDTDLGEDGEDGDRVYGADEAGEDKDLNSAESPSPGIKLNKPGILPGLMCKHLVKLEYIQILPWQKLKGLQWSQSWWLFQQQQTRGWSEYCRKSARCGDSKQPLGW